MYKAKLLASFSALCFVSFLTIGSIRNIKAQQNNPGVQQSGAVVAGHGVQWGPGVGQISDGGSPVSTVTSVFGRVGAVVATLGDYTFSLIGGTIAASQLPSGNANPGSFGGVNSIPSFTVDVHGNISAAAANVPAIPFAEITGTPTTLAGYGVASPLPIAQGGTSAATNTLAFNALAPTPTRAGDIIFWNGSNWVNLAGNNSGTAVLQETSVGVPSWSATGTGSYVGTQSFCPSGCTTTVAAGSTGTYTPTAGVTKGLIEVVAPGGGGAGAAAGNGTTTLDAGGGGGGGGYCGKEIAGIGTGLTVTLGALGTGGAANTDGGTGGTTSFDTAGSNFRATGGVGGTHTAANTVGAAAGGTGGAGVNCDLNIAGNGGGFSNFNAAAFALAGAGGSSGKGFGGGAVSSTANGAAGGNFGGGGGGGAGGLAATATGGAGGNPIVLVHEYK